MPQLDKVVIGLQIFSIVIIFFFFYVLFIKKVIPVFFYTMRMRMRKPELTNRLVNVVNKRGTAKMINYKQVLFIGINSYKETLARPVNKYFLMLESISKEQELTNLVNNFYKLIYNPIRSTFANLALSRS